MEKFTELKENFLQYLKVIKQSSAHTLRNYELDLKLFQTFGQEFLDGENVLFEHISKRMVRA